MDTSSEGTGKHMGVTRLAVNIVHRWQHCIFCGSLLLWMGNVLFFEVCIDREPVEPWNGRIPWSEADELE